MDKLSSLFISCNNIIESCTKPKALLTSLEEVYIVEGRDSWVTPKNIGLPHSWPLVFHKVTHGMSLGPPKIHIINLQIRKNTVWVINYLCLFPILSSSKFCIYLDLSSSGKRFSILISVQKNLLHSSHSPLYFSFVNLHSGWCQCFSASLWRMSNWNDLSVLLTCFQNCKNSLSFLCFDM